MIQIHEIKPIKLSGLSSLLITFPYSENIINEIKSLQTFYYHKAIYAWEVPITDLAKLCDGLTFYDDITLTLLENPNLEDFVSEETNDEPNLTDEEISKFKFKPYKHQIEAINYGLHHYKFLLLDEMGAGKTNEIIWLAETLKQRGKIDHCLIICGVDSLRQNWKKEIHKFSNEACLVLGEKTSKRGTISYESVNKRAEKLISEISEFFVIVNIATLRSESIIDAFKKSKTKFGMIAVDEVHRCANKSSTQGTNLLKLDANHKVAATGTLITNNPISCYLPLSWTDNDRATLTNFKSQYCKFGGFHNSQVIGYKNLDLLKEELNACSIRRTKDQLVDLPPKTVTFELVEMSDEHRNFYEAIKAGVKEEADKINLKASNLLALTTRLRQATACPGVLTSQDIVSSKIERCVEIVTELVEAGEKVVVMSTYKEPVYQLSRLLSQYQPLVNTGDIDDDIVSHNIDEFQNNPNCKIFLGTAARCATGITLNAAAYMVCVDQAWTASMNDQCYDRIYRVNNTRPAFITVLGCKDTIDERVYEVQKNKKDLSDFVVDDVQNELSVSLQDTMRDILHDL